MNKKCFFLAAMLAVSGVLVGIIGMVVKFGILAPLGLCQDQTAVELPFVLLRDEGLQYLLAHPQTETQAPITTEPVVSRPEATKLEPTQPEQKETSAPTEPEWTEPEFHALDRVLFIGDSRTCSLRDHSRIEGADYFCDVGMSVFNVGKKELTDTAFRDQTLAELLAQQEYTCVTVSLGLNEAGYPIESLMSAYQELVTQIVRTQPQAVIVLQGVLTVGRKWAESTPYASPSNLAVINGRIETLADHYRIFYIDANETFADGDGYLPDDMTWDGCHLYAKDTHLWSQWFCDAVEELNR